MFLRRLLLLAVFACLPSCGRLDRVSECNAVASIVNRALGRISERRDAGGVSRDTFTELAEQYRRLADELKRFEPKSKPLAETVGEYLKLAEDTGEELDRLAEAVAEHGAQHVQQHRQSFETLVRREQLFVSRFRAACRK